VFRAPGEYSRFFTKDFEVSDARGSDAGIAQKLPAKGEVVGHTFAAERSGSGVKTSATRRTSEGANW
jgi:hypothetical protein